MKISAHDYDYVCVLTLSGEFTADDLDAFRRVVTERTSAGARHFVIDCEHLEFIDSAALEAFLDLQDELGRNGGQIRLIALDETLSTILELTRLHVALEAHESLEHAVRSLR